MSCSTHVRLDGFVKPEQIIEYITRGEINATTVKHFIEVIDMPYVAPGYRVRKGSILIRLSSEIAVIFYYHANINLKENLDYYISVGLGDMIESETTWLSMDYSKYSVSIMKQITEEFGGWIDEIDQDDKLYYRINKKEN